MKIDHEQFRKASEVTRLWLLLNNIIRSIRAIAPHIPEGFDAPRLEKDILTLYDIADYAHLQDKIHHAA